MKYDSLISRGFECFRWDPSCWVRAGAAGACPPSPKFTVEVRSLLPEENGKNWMSHRQAWGLWVLPRGAFRRP